MRDWSTVGDRERSTSYGPVLDILNCEYPAEDIDRSKIKILTPGSGLGRITWELFSHGFHSEGCEFSWYMILASQFILNRCSASDVVFRIFPYIHETCNLPSWSDATTEATFPDVDLSATPEQGGKMEMGIGDFLDLYNEPGWHSVVTVFFLDTAHNIIEYVERIYKILLPGGLWVNNGPLLYHFAGSNEASLELTWEELKDVMVATGFQIELDETEKCSYVQNDKSMMTYNYKTILFTARKPA